MDFFFSQLLGNTEWRDKMPSGKESEMCTAYRTNYIDLFTNPSYLFPFLALSFVTTIIYTFHCDHFSQVL